MATNYLKPGETVTWTNGTGSDVASGSPVAMNDTVGIALVDIADGEAGEVAITGVWQVTKVAGTAWGQGAKVDWDAGEGGFDVGITAASGDVENCGIAAAAAESADTTAYLKLTPGTGTYTA